MPDNEEGKLPTFYDAILMLILLVFVLVNGWIIVDRYGNKPSAAGAAATLPPMSSAAVPVVNLKQATAPPPPAAAPVVKKDTAVKPVAIYYSKALIVENKNPVNKDVTYKKQENKHVRSTPEIVSLQKSVPAVPPTMLANAGPPAIKPAGNKKMMIVGAKMAAEAVMPKNGDWEPVKRAVNAKALRLAFSFSSVIPAAPVNVYFRILKPDGSLLKGNALYQVVYLNGEIVCSHMETVRPDKMWYIFIFNTQEPLQEGIYILGAYINGQKLGEVNIKLR